MINISNVIDKKKKQKNLRSKTDYFPIVSEIINVLLEVKTCSHGIAI